MMYSDKFVAVVKCNGKILREQDDVVYLPFGSEYSLYLNNLSNRKALVKISIDGREVTANGLIILPNSFTELERFIDNGDMSKGYKFKFIQKTKQIQENRGDRVEDGIVRIEWWFERERVFRYFDSPTTWISYGTNYGTGVGAAKSCRSSKWVASCSNHVDDAPNVMCCNSLGASVGESRGINDAPKVDEGITVEGSDSGQGFVYDSVGLLEDQSHVIVLKLMGTNQEQEEIQKPVTVSTKIRCRTCGTNCKSHKKFCGECGTRLVVK